VQDNGTRFDQGMLHRSVSSVIEVLKVVTGNNYATKSAPAALMGAA